MADRLHRKTGRRRWELKRGDWRERTRTAVDVELGADLGVKREKS